MVLPLLTSCQAQNNPKFSLAEWLTGVNNEMPTYFEADIDLKVRNAYCDVDGKVAQIIKENVAAMSLKKCGPVTEIREETKNYPIRYIIDRPMGDYLNLEVRIDEENLFMYAFGYDKDKNYLSEITEYTLPKEVGKKIIEEVDKRWLEVNEIAIESYEEVWEQTTPETFYSFIEGSTSEPSVVYKEKEVKDANRSLLDDIKEFVYIEIGDDVFDLERRDDVVIYGIENEYTIAMGRDAFGNGPYVQLIRYYDNPAMRDGSGDLNECRRTYSVDVQKIEVFMAKAKAM